jgi:hypothetical protein
MDDVVSESRKSPTVMIGFILAVFGLLLVMPVLQVWLMDRGYHGRWLDVKAADFQLTSATGGSVSLRQFSGRYVYLYFGYLRCDGYCQAQMVTLFLLGQQLIDRPVSLVFITLDPERDTPEQLRGVLDSLALPTFYALLPTSLAQAQTYPMIIKLVRPERAGGKIKIIPLHTAVKFFSSRQMEKLSWFIQASICEQMKCAMTLKN